MRKKISVVALIALFLLCFTVLPVAAEVKVVELQVQGCSVCGSTASRISFALKRLPGVMDVQAVVRRQVTVITYDSTQVTIQDMMNALDEAKLPVKGEPKILQ